MLDGTAPKAITKPLQQEPPAAPAGVSSKTTMRWATSTDGARYEKLLQLLFSPVSAVDDRMRG